jgi:aspartate kinase
VKPGSPLHDDLSNIGEVVLTAGQAIVSMVGTEIGGFPGFCGRALSALEAAGVSVAMISFGDAKINFSVIVPDDDCEKAVSALHRVARMGRDPHK